MREKVGRVQATSRYDQKFQNTPHYHNQEAKCKDQVDPVSAIRLFCILKARNETHRGEREHKRERNRETGALAISSKLHRFPI